MKNNRDPNLNEERDRIGYAGGEIPRWLMAVWLIFFIWALGYIVINFVPNLMLWLKSPPIGQVGP